MKVEGRRRVVLEDVRPSVDGGAFPIKRAVGDEVVVEFDAFADGHDRIACTVLHRRECDSEWEETAGEHVVNDRWLARFTVGTPGMHVFAALGWVDAFGSWVHELGKRLAAVVTSASKSRSRLLSAATSGLPSTCCRGARWKYP